MSDIYVNRIRFELNKFPTYARGRGDRPHARPGRRGAAGPAAGKVPRAATARALRRCGADLSEPESAAFEADQTIKRPTPRHCSSSSTRVR